MRLNDLKPAWKQVKLLNAMRPIDSNEILLIIENQEQAPKTNLQAVALNVVIFVVITFLCQGG